MRHILAFFGIAHATHRMDRAPAVQDRVTLSDPTEALARPLLVAAQGLLGWAEDLRRAGFGRHARDVARHADGLERTARALLNGEQKRGLF